MAEVYYCGQFGGRCWFVGQRLQHVLDAIVRWECLFDEEVLDPVVLGVVQEHDVGVFDCTPRVVDLLVVRDHAFWCLVVHDEAEVGFVVVYAECGRRDDVFEFVAQQLFFDGDPRFVLDFV